MIFVTVGTHEQPFDRMIQTIDQMKKENLIQEDVFIQSGFCTYEPQYCKWSKLIPYSKMLDYVSEARIVVTHGGPSTFIMPLQFGKTPIVVPRRQEFNEHVNNHQLDFAREVKNRQGTILVAEDMEELKSMIMHYDKYCAKATKGLESNNQQFNREIEKIVEQLFHNK